VQSNLQIIKNEWERKYNELDLQNQKQLVNLLHYKPNPLTTFLGNRKNKHPTKDHRRQKRVPKNPPEQDQRNTGRSKHTGLEADPRREGKSVCITSVDPRAKQ
jgi:hypothetical protein